MGKIIFYSQVSVSELAKRGKTVIVKETVIVKMPTTSSSINEVLANEEDMTYLARNFFHKGSSKDIVKQFLDNYRINSITSIKELGTTAFNDKIKEEDEWV